MSDAPTTAAILDADDAERARAALGAPIRPRPLGQLASLIASARRLTNKHVTSRAGFGKPQAWQEDGWEMFDLVGEQRFLTTTLANRVGQARLYVGRVPDDPVEEPEPLENDESLPARVFSHFGTTPAQRSQMVTRLACNLFVAGDGWFAGIPRDRMPGAERTVDGYAPLEELSLDDLEWRMLSVTEVSHGRGEVVIRLGEDSTEQIKCDPDDVFLIRVWRPHPRRAWEADSPTRSSLPVLRELVGLTMHISAQVDSRLAGAGVLIVPQSAKRALQVAAGIAEDSDEDPFTEALIEAMITPIQDRASASAVVPLVVVVPDEATEKFHHITFDKPLDSEAQSLREEAIRRLALGQDAPPELLLGTAGMNHWGAWLVREDVVTTHIEPPLALICDAITTQYLWPVLVEAGMDEDEARQYVVWYDVGHMVQRPNRLADALTLHDKNAIGDETLREAAGFTDADAPAKISRSVELAIAIATAHPNLIDNLPDIIAAFDSILNPVQARAAAEQAGAPTQDVDTVEDSTSQVVGNPNPRPNGQPARVARGTDTDTADRRAETTREPSAPPRGFATLGDQDDPRNSNLAAAVHLDPYAVCPDDCRYCALNKAMLKDTVSKIRATKAGWAPRPPAITAAGPSEHETSVAIMAIPANADAIPGPNEKHATLVYLGHLLDPDRHPGVPQDAALLKDEIADVVGAVADTWEPVTAKVAGVGELGEEGAKVIYLSPVGLEDVRSDLLGDPVVRDLYDSGTFEKYPRFRAHVTLGYGDEVSEEDLAHADTLSDVTFDALELWWGDERSRFPMRQGRTLEQDATALDAVTTSVPQVPSDDVTSRGRCARCGLPVMPGQPSRETAGGLVHDVCPEV